MRAALWVVALTLVAQPGPSLAQNQMYGAPAPRSTDAATMRDAALKREIRERFSRGIAAESRHDHAAAIAEFEAVLQRNPPEPQNSTAHYDLALAAAESGDLDRAAAELRAAIARDPGFLAAYANLIAVEIRRADLSAARAAADRFVALAPESARGLYSRGLVALGSGDLTTARSDFARLLSNNPAYAPAHYDLGIVELRAGRLESAERELSAALAAAPEYARARFALGIVFLRQGRRDEARVAFERVTQEASDPGLRNLAGAARDTLLR
ncbi:MAG: tetratricopeptide repeat protein [Candidatus Eremiobacteraeota bacterium]|nr:tetratricopeptide repeat protein [Candidatus Eremiobacteraeota bacterium]